MSSVELFYPGYVKKVLTFSMDDGRVEYDKMLIDVLRPTGIKGTFNLTCADRISPDEYRELYRGFEIANHCKRHPYVFDDDVDYKISDEPLDKENSDPGYIYRSPELSNFYYFHRSVGWRLITDPDTYIECIKACESELEAVFGEGSIRSYVWPFYEQNSKKVKEYLASTDYYAVRQSGLTRDTTGFDFPEESFGWRCNANHTNLIEMMELYESQPNDGKLKFFAFGVHSVDFERAEKWDELREFAERFGNRPDKFWYATVGEAFDYKRAADSLCMTSSEVINPSKMPVYIKVKGEKIIIPPEGKVSVI